MFPGGWVGIALILVRACVLLSLWMTRTKTSLNDPRESLFFLILLSVLIATGSFTPLACAMGAIVEIYLVWHQHADSINQGALSLMLQIALALLGPGAFSVDAKLFGRRLILDGKHLTRSKGPVKLD
jgi:uncharacterized membrane protein YphA (DoxX/SURF4 family)